MNREQVSQLVKELCDHYHINRNKMEAIRLVINEDTKILEMCEFQTTDGNKFRFTRKDD